MSCFWGRRNADVDDALVLRRERPCRGSGITKPNDDGIMLHVAAVTIRRNIECRSDGGNDLGENVMLLMITLMNSDKS